MKVNSDEIINGQKALYDDLISVYFYHNSEPQTEHDWQMLSYFIPIYEGCQILNFNNYCHRQAIDYFLDQEIYEYSITWIS